MNSPVQLLGQAAALKRCRTRIVGLLQELACVQSFLRAVQNCHCLKTDSDVFFEAVGC
jgi:hypothetical protein